MSNKIKSNGFEEQEIEILNLHLQGFEIHRDMINGSHWWFSERSENIKRTREAKLKLIDFIMLNEFPFRRIPEYYKEAYKESILDLLEKQFE